jgi:photosystem II stability/assembly factor-like uncharacterized protein
MSLAATVVLSAVQLLSSQTGFVGTGLGSSGQPAKLLATTDFGAHFRTIGPHVGRDTAVDDVFFLDRLHGWVVVWYVDTVRARLYRTGDGGRTWQARGFFSRTPLRSVDGGRRWRLVALRPLGERGTQAVYGLPSFLGSTVFAP